MVNYTRNVKKNGIPIYNGEKVIGRVTEDVFYKSLLFSRHSLRQPPGWAISIDSLDQAEQAGAERIEIYAIDTKVTYRTSIQHIREKGIRIERGGYEPQLALGFDGWIKQTRGSGKQLPLFGD